MGYKGITYIDFVEVLLPRQLACSSHEFGGGRGGDKQTNKKNPHHSRMADNYSQLWMTVQAWYGAFKDVWFPLMQPTWPNKGRKEWQGHQVSQGPLAWRGSEPTPTTITYFPLFLPGVSSFLFTPSVFLYVPLKQLSVNVMNTKRCVLRVVCKSHGCPVFGLLNIPVWQSLLLGKYQLCIYWVCWTSNALKSKSEYWFRSVSPWDTGLVEIFKTPHHILFPISTRVTK